MKYIEISVGKSINPNTGEQWYKADCKVSVGEDENEDKVFAEVKAKIDSWLPNPFPEKEEYKTIGKNNYWGQQH